MLKKRSNKKITEEKVRRRKEQTPSKPSENMSGHRLRPSQVPFPSGRPLDAVPKYMTQNQSSQEETAENTLGQNIAFDIQSSASSLYEPLIPDFSLSSSGMGRDRVTT